MRSAAQIVARNSIIVLVSKLSIKLISFFFTILIARLLGEAEFGRYALIWAYVATFAAFSDFGLATFIIRELARGQTSSQHLAENVIIFRLILATITLGLISLTTQFVEYSATTSAHIILAGTILLLYAVQDPLDSIFQARERADLSALIRILGQLAFVLSGAILLIWFDWGITGLIIASLFNAFISAVLAWYLIRRYLGGLQWRLNPSLWPKLLLTALPFGLMGFAINWSQKIDTVILSLFWPVEVIGWYNGAYNLILGMIIISNSLNIALYPTMSKESAVDYEVFGHVYRRILKYLCIISLPLAVIFSTFSRQIILIFYGPAFMPAIAPLTILAWVLPLIFVSEFLRYTSLVLGRERQAVLAILSTSLMNIILNFLFIPKYGLLAAAVTTVLTEAVLVTIYFWQLRTEISLSLIGGVFWKPSLAMVIMLVTIEFFDSLSLPLAAILGGIVYLGTLFSLRSLGTEDELFLRKILDQFSPVTSS